ncbi:cytochrome P450 [Pseudonocardia sp.]|uniref:cytochrome P450 n=1 Tax=Pseudonocardia sp. TaxID=60912 RepID=UPI003D11824A
MFDPADPAFLADPYPVFALLRARSPVHDHPGLEMPVAVSHAACAEVLRSRDLGRIWVDAQPPADFPAFNLLHRNSLLEREGPSHARLRALVAGVFGRGHTARLAPAVRDLADGLVGDMCAAIERHGQADVMEGLAAPLPIAVIAELLAVPEPERSLLRGWSTAIVAMYEPDPGEARRAAAERASAGFVTALRELAALRARRPGADLVSDLLSAGIDPDELVGTAALLLMAGHEATVNVIGNGVLALLHHPRQWAALVAGAALEPAVEELVRYDPPLQLFERTAVRDTAVAGHPVPEGTRIAALLGAAARDPAVFDSPDSLDLARHPNPHLGFGMGVHYCLGAPLARLEVAAALDALRRRLPGLRRPDGPAGEPVRRPDLVMRGLRELPVAG